MSSQLPVETVCDLSDRQPAKLTRTAEFGQKRTFLSEKFDAESHEHRIDQKPR